MSLKNNLKKATVYGLTILELGLCSGCAIENESKYDFNGEIDGEVIKFHKETKIWAYKNNKGYENNLEVTKPNNVRIEYIDEIDDDLKIEKIKLYDSLGEFKKQYSIEDSVGKPIIDSAQVQFNNYLEKILEKKNEEIKLEQEEFIKLLKQ